MLIIAFEFDSCASQANRSAKETELSAIPRLPSGNLNYQLVGLLELVPKPRQVFDLSSDQEIVNVSNNTKITIPVDVDT